MALEPIRLCRPDGYELDIAYMARPGAEEMPLDLILEYRANVALYPDFPGVFPPTPSAASCRVGTS